MRASVLCVVFACGGCSTAPLAGLMDCVLPSRAKIADDGATPDLPPRPAPPRGGDPLLPRDLPPEPETSPRVRP